MKTFFKILAFIILTIIIYVIALITYYIYKPSYTAEHFGITTIKSNSDKDGDGMDD